jgi:leader peptidase (prepilin peptidase)/N-methyltransferase
LPEIAAGLFGLLIGSFLNVCIHRWPRDLSVVRPRSHCNECGSQIAWYDNIPVLSYGWLRGRCRACSARISWRYPVVELLTALCFAWFIHAYGLSMGAARYCLFGAIVIALIFTDIEMLLLPNELTIGGLVAGLAFALFERTFEDALLGAAVPAITLWLVGWLFRKIRHKEGLGLGDVKMISMIGAFLGLRGALFTVICGSVAGSIIGLIWIRVRGEDAGTYQLPFGAFLGAAALMAAVFAQKLPIY